MLTFEQMLTPIWDTDTVYGESLTMVRDADGAAAAPLLYPPIEILKVTNAACNTEYREGLDWFLQDGCLHLMPDSRIFAFTQAELYPAVGQEGKSFPMPGGNILFSEGSFFHERQIAVTYTCKKGGWAGPVPACAKDSLPRTWAALSGRGNLHLLLYGDSISWGGNASKMVNAEPFQPNYGDLFSQALARAWGAGVRFTNAAIGGRDTAWGVQWVDHMVNSHAPDLVVLAFGMNDGAKSVEEFATNTRAIIRSIRKKKPETEFILVATSTPNPILTDPAAPFWGNQLYFKAALDAIAADPAMGGGMAVADITGMQQALHARKRFVDTTGNHVNHPNDFFHRLHAQFLAGILTPPAAPAALPVIRELCQANGAPGFEDEVLTVARRHAPASVTVTEDKLRNLYLHRAGNTGDKPVFLLDAHADEVAMMVHSITPAGTLRFVPLGGWNPCSLVGSPVLVRNCRGQYIPGMVAAKPTHFMTGAERNAPPCSEDMVIDVGACSAREAVQTYGIRMGEPILPDTAFRYDPENGVMYGKAFDCRIGCAALLETLRRLEGQELAVDVVGVLSSQEELGERGIAAAVARVRPDIALCFEGAPADDTFTADYAIQTALKKGPMLRFMDRSVICSPRYQRWVLDLAAQKDIPVQTSVRRGGSNNGAVINAQAVPVVVAGVPVRYAHAPCGIASCADFEATVQLAVETIRNMTPDVLETF